MGKILSFALETASRLIDRVPFEKMIVKPMDTAEDRKEILSILQPKAAEERHTRAAAAGRIEPRRSRPRLPKEDIVSDEETVDYQNREIGKLLLRMERHYAQGLRIAGRVCDCGAQKHLLDIEAMAEETVPMVDDPGVYNRLTDWVQRVGPISIPEAAASGKYDSLYPQLSHQARDFRKEIIGTVDAKALWPHSDASLENLVRKAGDVRVVSVEKPPELPAPPPVHFEIVQPEEPPPATEEAAAPAETAQDSKETEG
jgi:hypothetical protein